MLIQHGTKSRRTQAEHAWQVLSSLAQGVESVIEQAKAAGLPPIFAAYTALIRAWGQRRQMVNVRQVLLDMKEDGVQPNELHYRAAISAHAQHARIHEAEVVCCHYLPTSIIGQPPSAACCISKLPKLAATAALYSCFCPYACP